VFHLRLHFMGYSAIPANPDHFVSVKWNGEYLGDAVWDGQSTLLYWPAVRTALLKEGENKLSLQIKPNARTGGVDLALLDWVEIAYSRVNRVDADGQEPVAAEDESVTAIAGAAKEPLLVYDTQEPRVLEVPAGEDGRALLRAAGVKRAAFETRFQAVGAGGGFAPKAILVSHPAELRAAGMGAEFIIITHSRLRPAADRLAAAREAEGLKSLVVDIDDVYDRFQDGFFGPEAIRTFLKYAWTSWTPKPRYVLLMGDASWDYKNGTVADEYYADWHWSMATGATMVWKNSSTPYKPGEIENDRQLIPTMQWQSPFGHAASDNWFAAVNGVDDLPELAIGRFPVVALDEAQAIVDKTLEASSKPAPTPPGALFITDDIVHHQRESDRLVEEAEKAGWAATRIYPKAEEKDNAQHTREILEAFDKGQSVVIFAGHGGRYIWRTGPPDLKKNHDLFTLAHLDQLKPGAQLPLVVSLTCYSAPFDHPTADSIGEKLLRIPHKGAVAIVASSWRTQASFALGEEILKEVGTKDNPRLGDSWLAAQRMPQSRGTRNSYNLLGDPTVPFQRPSPPPGVTVATEGGPDAPPEPNKD